MKFSVVTPSFRQPEWLRLCMASVADQEGVEVEHIVQDNNSGPEVAALEEEFPRARIVQEADRGMYDAVNQGLKKAGGEICAYLNCDEQYLPGALRRVMEYFQEHPEVDVLFGDVVVIDPDGQYICSRKVMKPLPWHTKSCFLSTFTAATFFRRGLLERHALFFSDQLRDLGDCDWVLRVLGLGLGLGVVPEYLASFVDSGANMNLLPNAQRERRELRRALPAWMRWGRPLWSAHHRLRRLVHGHYGIAPFSYAIYHRGRHPSEGRVLHEVSRGRALWPGR